VPVLTLPLEAVCALVYETHRAYVKYILNHEPPLPWEYSVFEARTGIRQMVEGVLLGMTPQQLHDMWSVDKRAKGWSLGPFQDGVSKTTPYLKPWFDLTPEQQQQDILFHAMILSLTHG
jgi:hypothetical protein